MRVLAFNAQFFMQLLKHLHTFFNLVPTMQYLLCVPRFSGCIRESFHKKASSGKDTQQGRASEQRLHVIQPADNFWKALKKTCHLK